MIVVTFIRLATGEGITHHQVNRQLALSALPFSDRFLC